MMQAVTTALSDVIGWAGTVLTAVITDTGDLHALLPLWAVGIAISALMLGIRFRLGQLMQAAGSEALPAPGGILLKRYIIMAISLYFGLPGCGKTTMLAKLAADAIRKGTYEHVYTNVYLNLPGVTLIDNECIGKYSFFNSLLLIDEATLFADSRDHKNFSKGKLEFFLLHRHYNTDIALFTQQWDGVDRKIRVITDRVYYIYKTFLTGKFISKCYRIPYGIIIPDPKTSGEKLGEIIQGYARPPWYVRLFAIRIYRPRYYKYFDSWELKPLPDLPEKYETITEDEYQRPIAWRWRRTTRKFLKISRKKSRKEKYARFFKRILFS